MQFDHALVLELAVANVEWRSRTGNAIVTCDMCATQNGVRKCAFEMRHKLRNVYSECSCEVWRGTVSAVGYLVWLFWVEIARNCTFLDAAAD